MIKARWAEPLEDALKRQLPFLFQHPVNPHLLTLLGAVVSLLGALAFARGAFLAGGVLLLGGGAFDLLDGVIARHHGRASRFGGLLDSTVDRIVDMGVLLAISIYYARVGATWYAFLGGLALIGSVSVSYVKARGEVDVPDLGVGWFERGERIGLLILGGISGWMPAALAVVAVGAWWTAGQRMALAHRKMQDLGGALKGAAEGPR